MSSTKNGKKRKIIIFCIPFSGHMNPLLAISNELANKRNNQVIFYSNLKFKQSILSTGAQFREYSYFPMDKIENQPSDKFHSFELIKVLIKVTFYILPELIRVVDKEKPDIIVYDKVAAFVKYLNDYYYLNKKEQSPRMISISTSFVFRDSDVVDLTSVLFNTIGSRVLFSFKLFLTLIR
jgi:UDP:flavonoid glycosyltransferase YjiC (YdhE family)